ncbi:FAD-dependent oxidoreductase [Geothrix sp. PMB-07]|uniref:FAD-dependent oxidoreductase n=1 Tax=Geothrix sp. PMB-07 TaxID=3068640 RepID=UPI002741EA5E|nr:FAD-dependent oxidoreductase [Geothrix sp. PMB-07]WLT33098.1 FAD-dependent oxidoreductase [Geothrix sp. PMB-07]
MSEPAWPTPPTGTCAQPASTDVDVAILGAGIHGAALARELTLRGVSCALVDKGEVGGGTSQWSSQLLHGGIRYMLTGDITQMREGLAERATWARIAPQRCRWEAFWMPHRFWAEGLAHRVGIGLYDHWGADRPDWPSALLRGGVPSRVFEADPRSAKGPFRGATAYADLMTWDQELTKDLAASSEARLLDFHEPGAFVEEGGALVSLQLRDRRDGTVRTLAARKWVFALGPWTDGAMAAWFGETRKRLRLSSGIHLWFDAVPGCERPWAIRRPKGRILFVIPRDGLLQVGTTEREVEDGWVPILDSEREELFLALEENLPAIAWRRLPIRVEELGVRPLVAAGGTTSHLSREAVLEQHARFHNLTLVLGGKLTTARALMDRLATELTGLPCAASRTKPLRLWDGQAAGIR